MDNYIVTILITFVIDYVLCLSIKQIFKLSTRKIGILFLQVLNLSVVAVYLFLEIRFYQFVLLKLFAMVIICLLITDSYKFVKLAKITMTSIVLMFSYFGFFAFMTEFIKAIIFEVFKIKLSYLFDFIIIFALICYIFAIFALIHNLSKKKILKTFLRRVSFLAFGKHIEIVGLIDTGNVLYDSKTSLPVIIVKASSLKKYLPENTYKNIIIGNYLELGVSNYLSLVSVAGKSSDIPIINIKKATVFDDVSKKTFDCVIGIVNHSFENSSVYDCLLHRDFV